jgi:hypothetical protein
MASSNLTEMTTHDLWVVARQFDIDISRPTPTTIKLTIKRPIATEPGHIASVVDGAVLLLGTKPLSSTGYPEDGTQYLGADTLFGAPAADKIDDFQVISFFSEILGRPWPAGTVSEDGSTNTFEITVTGTDPNTLYYASIHAATNVLQYYPIGIQSYALEAARVEKDSSTYAGSIPTLPYAPTAPTPGMVYFDQQLNLVQYWDAARSVWIPTRADSILSGDQNPGIVGHAYLLGGNRLRVFDGLNWIDGTPTNLQLRVGAGWVPLGQVSSNTMFPAAPAIGDLFYNFTTQRVQYWDGVTWQIPTPSSTLLQTAPATFVPAFTVSFTYEGTDMVTPYAGLLFYNTRERQLNVFNGSTWSQANTAQQGTTTTDKIGIGNDGSYDERLRLITVLKAQLGYPALCIELSEEQFNVAIDNALDTYRQLSMGAYERRFFIFQLNANQVVYHLNNPGDRTDAIVSVMKVHRMNLYGVTGSGPDNTWGQAWAQQWYNMGGHAGDLLSVHLVHSWSEEYQKIFAGDIPFTWNEARRELFLQRIIRTPEKVVLEVELERSEQELLLDRWCKQFLQNWALAECKEYLGMIRSKYSSGTPGAAGTITLNGETMLAEARQDFTELKQALLDYEYQNAEHGNFSFLMG